jgi:hypothetical protein
LLDLTVLTSRKRKAGILLTKIGCLSGEVDVARNKSRAFTEISIKIRILRVWVRREISYLALESDNIGDVTDALRHSDEIPPGPLPCQISRSLIAVRTCKGVPLVLSSKKAGKVTRNRQFSYASFRHAILISVISASTAAKGSCL